MVKLTLIATRTEHSCVPVFITAVYLSIMALNWFSDNHSKLWYLHIADSLPQPNGNGHFEIACNSSTVPTGGAELTMVANGPLCFCIFSHVFIGSEIKQYLRFFYTSTVTIIRLKEHVIWFLTRVFRTRERRSGIEQFMGTYPPWHNIEFEKAPRSGFTVDKLNNQTEWKSFESTLFASL